MVYIDKLSSYLSLQVSQQARKHGNQWSHLFADSVEELHEFAESLGLKREWFQDKKNFPHYDIIKSKKVLAIELGAKEIDLKMFLKSNKYI